MNTSPALIVCLFPFPLSWQTSLAAAASMVTNIVALSPMAATASAPIVGAFAPPGAASSASLRPTIFFTADRGSSSLAPVGPPPGIFGSSASATRGKGGNEGGGGEDNGDAIE